MTSIYPAKCIHCSAQTVVAKGREPAECPICWRKLNPPKPRGRSPRSQERSKP